MPPRRATAWLLSLCLAAGCHGEAQRPSRTLRLPVRIPIPGFLPTTSNQFELGVFTGLAYEGLVAATPDGALRPGLATRWESRDLATWRFHLRTGVRFHDGTPFTAAHVVAAWSAALAQPPGSDTHPWPLDGIAGALAFSRGARRDIPGLRVIDDSTLDIVLDHPSADLPATTASWSLRIAGPGSASAVVNGTGPWSLAQGKPGDSTYTFVRNPRYWGTTTRLDSLQLWVIDPRTFATRMERGDLDCFAGAEDFQPILLRSDFAIRPSAPHVVVLLSLNHRNRLLRQRAVRQAISLGIDRAVLARAAASPAVELHASALPRGLVPGDTARRPIPHDPVGAAQRLAPLDRRRPLRIAWRGDSTSPLLLTLRAQFAALGLRTSLVDPATDPTRAFLQDAVDLLIWRWVPPYPAPGSLVDQLFHSRNTSGLANAYGIHDPALDHALDSVRRMPTGADRDRALAVLGRRVFDEAPGIFLWQGPTLEASSQRITACPGALYGTDYAQVDLATRP